MTTAFTEEQQARQGDATAKALRLLQIQVTNEAPDAIAAYLLCKGDAKQADKLESLAWDAEYATGRVAVIIAHYVVNGGDPVSDLQYEAAAALTHKGQRVFTALATRLAAMIAQPVSASHVPFVATLQQISRLNAALEAITFDEFCDVLRATIGARPDYAQGCWPSFRQWPINYCATRGPIRQGEGLFALALAKMNHADATGRDVHCPGDRQCHRASMRCVTCGEVERVCHKVTECKYHVPVSDAKIRESVLANIGGLGTRHGTRIEYVNAALLREFGAHVDYTEARGTEAVTALLATGEVITHSQHGEGWLQRPLTTLKVGDHSTECPITNEYWNERAQCDPSVCAHVPIARIVDDDEDVYQDD